MLLPVFFGMFSSSSSSFISLFERILRMCSSWFSFFSLLFSLFSPFFSVFFFNYKFTYGSNWCRWSGMCVCVPCFGILYLLFGWCFCIEKSMYPHIILITFSRLCVCFILIYSNAIRFAIMLLNGIQAKNPHLLIYICIYT